MCKKIDMLADEMRSYNECLDSDDGFDRISALDRIYGIVVQLCVLGYDVDIDGDGVDGYEAIYVSHDEETKVVIINN